MLMYPKNPGKKKRRKKHPPSILHQKDGTCYLCMRLNNDYRKHIGLEKHHVYDGKANKPISEENGFVVYLCRPHHRESPEAVHVKNENMRMIQEDAQREYEKTHSRQEFIKLIGRNYIMEDKDGEEKA